MNENMIPKDHKVIPVKSKSIQIRVKVNLLDRIEYQARKEGRSRSNMITRAIEFYLDSFTEKTDYKPNLEELEF